MFPTFQYAHPYGYRAQRFRCPLLFPQATGESCAHAQFRKGKGCVKDPNWELGAQMRVTLPRDHPLYQAIYHQRTSTERGNSQSKALGLEHPKVRNIHSVRTLNTLTYLIINARALQRARSMPPCSPRSCERSSELSTGGSLFQRHRSASTVAFCPMARRCVPHLLPQPPFFIQKQRNHADL